VGGLRQWRVWHMLAWQELKQRYRRATLGPLWLTLSMGVQVVTMSLVTAFLFNQPLSRYVPYVSLGFIFWMMLSGMVNEGAMSFITSAAWIHNVKMPLVSYVFLRIWSNVIALAHNMLIFVVLMLVYSLYSVTLAWILLTLPLVVICIAWLPLLLALLSTRFRDLPAMISNIFSLLFWLTPIIYPVGQLGERRYLAELNPFTHFLALLREPLMGIAPEPTSFAVVTGVGLLGWIATFPIYARFRGRVAYWL